MVAIALEDLGVDKRDRLNAVDWIQLALTAIGLFIALGGILIAIITGAVPLHPFRRRRERYQAAVQQRLADEQQQLVADKLDEISSNHLALLDQVNRHSYSPINGHATERKDQGTAQRHGSRHERYHCPPFYAKDLHSLSLDEVIRIERLITTLQETIMDRFHYACRFDNSIDTISLFNYLSRIYSMIWHRNPPTPPTKHIKVLTSSSAALPAASAEVQQRNKEFLLHFRVTRVGILHGDWFHFVDVVGPYAFVVLPPGWILRALGYKDIIGYPAVKRYYYYDVINSKYSDTRPEGGWLFDLNVLDSGAGTGASSRVSRASMDGMALTEWATEAYPQPETHKV